MKNIAKGCLLFVGGIIIGGVVAVKTTIKYVEAVTEETKNRFQSGEPDEEEM